MIRSLLIVCLFCAPGSPAPAQPARAPLPDADSAQIAALARALTAQAPTDSARAAALYEWVARNVAYDVPGYLAGRLSDGSAEQVFRERVAVCGGYVTLFVRMAREAGLFAQPVLGYAKGFDYRHGVATRRPNHSWVALHVGGRWRLVDPTWGAGTVADGRFQPHFTWDYFLIEPDELILSHFPQDDRWQLLPAGMRRSEFERLPAVPRTLMRAGFEPSAIRASANRSKLRDFPLVGAQRGVRIVQAPVAGTVARAARVSVEIVWPDATEMAIVSGGVWTRLSRRGDHFQGEAAAQQSAISVVGRTDGRPFETLLHYRVE